jgi:hypothetical protein
VVGTGYRDERNTIPTGVRLNYGSAKPHIAYLLGVFHERLSRGLISSTPLQTHDTTWVPR